MPSSIDSVASTGKPMIISTVMANVEEISEELEAARDGGRNQVALFHFVSDFPAPAPDYSLRTIPDMAARYGTAVGLSDHTLDNATAAASVALGSTIIEKHVTLDTKGGGPDDGFAHEPGDLAQLCRDARTAWQAIGGVEYGQKSSEKGNAKLRRSLYFVKDLKAGQRIGVDDIRSVRPGFGAAPKHLPALIGTMARVGIVADTPVDLDLVER